MTPLLMRFRVAFSAKDESFAFEDVLLLRLSDLLASVFVPLLDSVPFGTRSGKTSQGKTGKLDQYPFMT